jgi:ribonuclease D
MHDGTSPGNKPEMPTNIGGGISPHRDPASAPRVPDYRLVASSRDLETLARSLERRTSVAVDLEADSMYHFRERVCLLQVAAEDVHALVDPLCLENLSPLERFFGDRGIRKVFHGADYDVRSLYRDFRIVVRRLFDTQLACMFLGIRETGLDAVLRNRFGVHLDKKYQRKDWSRRPLSREMIEYALSDTLYLIPLADELTDELAQKGRLEWVREECDLLSCVRPAETDNGPLFLRFKGAGKLSRRRLAVLEALLVLRQGLAERKNRPPYKVLSNASLMTLAVEMPTTHGRLARTRALSPKQTQMFGDAVLQAVGEALEIEEDRLPVYPRKRAAGLSPSVPPRLRALKAWRGAMAVDLDIEPGIFMNNALLTALAVNNPGSEEELARVEGLKQWQLNCFGRNLLKALGRRSGGRRRHAV